MRVGFKPTNYFGKKASHWKGGRIDRSGYVYIFMPKHSQASKQGYIAEHRIVMEKYLGRPLVRGEVVHHINHNKKDNRIANLKLFSSPGQHTLIEHTDIYERQKVLFKGKHFSQVTEFKKKV